jgi:hypothetical protein
MWIGTMLVAAGALTGSALVLGLGGVSCAAGVASWMAFIVVCFVRRGARIPDATAILIATAHVSLIASAVLGIVLLFVDDARLTTAYGMSALVGWLTVFITGATTRIVPMLLRSRPGAAAPAPSRWRFVPVLAIAPAALMLTVGAALGRADIVIAAAWLQAAGAMTLVVSHAARRP